MKLLIKITFLLALVGLVFSCKGPEGEKAEAGKAETNVTKSTGDKLNVDSAKSTIFWEGTKPAGKHVGTIKVKSGTIDVTKGEVTGGSFTMDMNSITNTDQQGGDKAYLEAHLKGLDPNGDPDDFFNVTKYPEAKFEITKITKVTGDPKVNSLVYGNLTLKGVTKSISFKANINVSNSGATVSTPPFKINRTEWGINYKSKSMFSNLKDKFINDEIGLTINLVAK